MALGYFLIGIAQIITIIGIPFGLQSMKLGILALWPFGSKIRDKEDSGCLNTFMNVVWFIFGGFLTILGHLGLGVLLCITIIGIPFGKMHFRLAKLALAPFGSEVV